METQYKISVVIPLYNKQNAIARTLESVFNQTVKNFEVVVVDDGSKDNSLQVVQAIQDPRLRVIHKENGGVSSARNSGIRNAKGEFIALLDGDDLWEPTCLEEMVKMIDDFPDAAIWGVSIAFIKNGRLYKWNQGLGEGYRGYVKNYFGIRHSDLYCSSSVIIRKEAFEKVGYFDERISSSEDLDMWYRIILHYPIAFYDKILVYYNQDAENRVAYDTDVRFPLTKDIKYYFDKHNEEFERNPVFSHFMNNYVAANLLKEGYYFGSEQERIDSDEVVKKLRYQDIHPKYRWIFKTPRWFGYIVYKIVCLRKRLKE
jgi:glycosyltransferase involved in cell wall biosynthesis